MRRGASPPTLRFYRWSPAALTIGYAQDRDRDVDLVACRERGIEVLRRVTGGRAVLHDAELTYSVCAPARLPGFGPRLDDACGRIAEGLVVGLRTLGLGEVESISEVRRPSGAGRHPACFAAASRREIAVRERKLVGSAQRRAGGAFLQHGSILVASHAAPLAGLLRGPAGKGHAQRMTGLAEFLKPPPAPGDIAAALAAGCATAWGVRFERGEPTAGERLMARALADRRYRSEAWNAGPARDGGHVDTGTARPYHAAAGEWSDSAQD